MKKSVRKQIFDKLLDNANTLRIIETKWKRGKKHKGDLYYPFNEYQVVANIRDVREMLVKSTQPFDLWKALDFIEGKINKLTLDNGDRKLEVEI